MSKVWSCLVGLAFVCVGGVASANCACQCIEGVARTLCTTVDEAKANPNACGGVARKVACDVAPPSADAPQRYEPPQGATDCRGARLWDPHTHAYTMVAKVCDLAPVVLPDE
jgi:hypothetical protein